MLANQFWEKVEKGLNTNSKTSPRIGLFDIAMATLSIKESLEILPALLENITDYKILMNYTFVSCGSIFALKYYCNNPETKQEDISRIHNLIEIGFAVYNMKKKLETENTTFFKIKIKEGLLMMEREAESLLKDEIDKLNLRETLSQVQDKKSYLDHYLGLKKTRKLDVSSFILTYIAG